VSQELLSGQDYSRSYTGRMLPSVEAALSLVDRRSPVRRSLDIGCGYGGMSKLIGERFSIDDIHGVDLDGEAVKVAVGRGVQAQQWDLNRLPLPYDDGTFDIVTSFGVLNYLSNLDGVLLEAHRMLSEGGHLIVALPNLLSWHNRVMTLRGYQPRDVEISSRVLAGVHPRYRRQAPVGHVAGVSTVAFKELAEHLGFETVGVIGAAPAGSNANPAVSLLDKLAARRPALARRFVYVGRKTSSGTSTVEAHGWWQRVDRQ
jgi:SAM-dependent methyltransferase